MEFIPIYNTKINISPQNQTSDAYDTVQTDGFVEEAAETAHTVDVWLRMTKSTNVQYA